MSVAPKFSKLKKSKNWWKEGEREEKAMKGQPLASSRGPVKFRMPTAQNLVPIRLDLDIDGQRFKDCFTWNPSDPDSEIVVFARRTAKDLKLPPGFITVIASAIQSQIVEFRSLEGQDMYSGERIVPIKLDLRVNRTVIRDQFLWESKLKAARMHIFVRRGGPNYQTGLAKMSAFGEELGVPLEVYGPEATMTEICKQAIECIVDEA